MTETEFELRKAEEEARLAALRAAGVTPPSGRMWIGENISPEQFSQLPEGARVAPPAPVLQRPRGLLDIARESDRPGTRTIAIRPWQPSISSGDPSEVRFAANEQIQRAIGNGMAPNEAIARYGAGLFQIPKTTPPKPIKLGTDGVAVIDQSGQLQVLRPPTPRTTIPPVLNAIESKQLSAAYAERARAVSDLRDPMKRMERPQIQQSLDDANRIISKYEARVSGGNEPTTTSIPPAPTTTPIAPIKEVIRITADGRRAIFDATTKKFIRYAE